MNDAPPERLPVHVEAVMGTMVSFHVWPGPCPPPVATRAIETACASLHRADQVFSTWDPDSPMSRFRAGRLDGSEVPPEVVVVLDLCLEMRALSGGWFDPWVMPGGVDPTGLVKGWAVERALAHLADAGVGAAMLNGGGDIALLGDPPGGGPWKIGIRHPWRPDGLACVLEATGAVATSGSYERGPHLRDPSTGALTTAAASATVTGPSLTTADALATALAVGGDEVLARVDQLDGYAGYLVRADGSVASTAGIVFAQI